MVSYLEPPAGGGDSALPVPSPAAGRPLEVSVVLVEPFLARRRDNRTELDEDIASLNLEAVSYLAVLTERWDLAKVDAIELEYRCWLQCVRDFPAEQIVPRRDCDLYWHCHILCLDLYLKQTTRLFGRPLLHYPFAGRPGAPDEVSHRDLCLKGRQVVGELMSRVSVTRPDPVSSTHLP